MEYALNLANRVSLKLCGGWWNKREKKALDIKVSTTVLPFLPKSWFSGKSPKKMKGKSYWRNHPFSTSIMGGMVTKPTQNALGQYVQPIEVNQSWEEVSLHLHFHNESLRSYKTPTCPALPKINIWQNHTKWIICKLSRQSENHTAIWQVHAKETYYSIYSTCRFLTPFCIVACHYTVYTGLVNFIRLIKCQLQTTCFLTWIFHKDLGQFWVI